jgi:hypothetical protein
MNLLEKLPTLVEDVNNPNFFSQLQMFLRDLFQDENFYVKEAGYYNNGYVGVVYYGKKTGRVEELLEFAKNQSSHWACQTD